MLPSYVTFQDLVRFCIECNQHCTCGRTSIDRSIDLFIFGSIVLSIDLSIHLSIYLSIYRSIYLSIYLSIYRSIYLSITLSIYLSIYRFVCMRLDVIECTSITIWPHRDLRPRDISTTHVIVLLSALSTRFQSRTEHHESAPSQTVLTNLDDE